MPMLNLRGAVGLTHLLLGERLKPGDRAVDATCGNGRDTLLLAQLVGPAGHVWAFDIQPAALSATRTLLSDHGCLAQVTLLETGHERMAKCVESGVRAVAFNLGYLPGGDKSLITRPAHTLAALEQASGLLEPGGIITIAIYTGHPGGGDEGEMVEQWASALPAGAFSAWCSRPLNRPPDSPYVVLIEKGVLKPGGGKP